MEVRSTLFQYLYHTLTTQIKTQKIRKGDHLPSIRQLSDMYNVGVRTVKDVLKALGEDGYIKTEVRKNAIVVYEEGNQADPTCAIQALLSRRDSIIDGLTVFYEFIPHILTSACLLCNDAEIRDIEKVSSTLGQMPRKEQLRVSSGLTQSIIAKLNNPLLTDLYIDLELHCEMPAVGGLPNPYGNLNLYTGHDPSLSVLMAQRNYRDIYQLIEKTFQQGSFLGQGYLQELAGRYPPLSLLPQQGFEWDAKKGRVHTYTHIARDITLKVCSGQYEDGRLLPNITEMSHAYQVSPSTIMKALATLNALGLVRTMNGKGSVVTMQAAKRTPMLLKEARLRKDVHHFLCAMQLLTLTCKKLALLGACRLSPEQMTKIDKEIRSPNSHTLPCAFIIALAQAQPNGVLYCIYANLQELLDWGLFLAFLRRGPAQFSILQAQCAQAYTYLQEHNDEAFAGLLQDICLSIFQELKRGLVAAGAENVAALVEPPPEIY